jgi:exopolysaccharide biosynthesis predicted pyruvyltransferase EpsI
MELNLENYLEKFRDRKVDFFRFNGNYGDSFIWHGTMILLNKLNIQVDYVDQTTDSKNDVLLIDGGGNFVDYYKDVRKFLEAKKDSYKQIVLLPHTIYGEKQKAILPKLGSNITIFCRERISYDFVKEYAKNCEVYLWHDCAFYNDFKSITKKGLGVLNAFREDTESVHGNLPSDNFDISLNGWAKKPLDIFLEKLNQYETINTDRLHAAIVATLLGKTVNLYPNSYFKNQAVYEYSLKSYPNIKFIN